MIRNFLSRIYRGMFFHEEWNIGVVHEPISVFLRPNVRPKVHWLPPPDRGKYLADPFALKKNGRVYVVCEEFDYLTSKGRIVSIELVDASYSSKPKVAIELPFHVSYPYLLQHEGEIYCIPETYWAREVSLYKAEEFPDRWRKVSTLVRDIAALDSTVFEYEGRWWLACADEERDSGKLFLWHAPDLFGPWRPHVANPVKTDTRSSRPAGAPFTHDGCMYRPSQDCSRTYGGQIVLNRIIRLTPTEFKEEQVAVIKPLDGCYPDGVHTISGVGDITILDGKRFRFLTNAFKGAKCY